MSDSSDEFEVFNQTLPAEDDFDEIGIQRKPQRTLQELIENQPGKSAPVKSAQSQIPPSLPKSSPPTPHQPQPVRPDPVDLKRKRDQKGKDVIDAGKSRPTREEEAQRAAKRQKVSHLPQRGLERADSQPLEPQAWLPAPMFGGEPMRDDVSIRDFNGGIGCHVASALEESLLLPKDMAELRCMGKNEVFNNSKRYLSMV